MDIHIEKLLRWAFVMELTKRDLGDEGPRMAAASSWAIVERIGELGTMVDGSGAGAFGDAEPHPDALAIEEAVLALDDGVVTEGDEHDLLAGWGDLGEAGEAAIARAWDLVTCFDDGRRIMRSPISSLVRRIAILGEWPEWHGDAPSLVLATGREGRPLWYRRTRIEVRWDLTGVPTQWLDVEVDGFDRVRQRPHKGAYRKSALSYDVSPILARRLEYGLTHAALVALASRLDGLGGRCVLPPIAPAVPWGADEVAKMVE